MELRERVIIALDVDSIPKTTELVRTLVPFVSCFKVGLELITMVGAPAVVNHIRRLGGDVFFDGKFNDIPNTMAGATRAVASLEVKMFTVHASAGLEAIQAAVANKGKAKCLVVTVLTSLNESDSTHIFGLQCQEKVIQFAKDAAEAGADGIVCSPSDLELLENVVEVRHLLKVTPGIRPSWSQHNDQKRALTPAEAIHHGAAHLIVGRPITNPPLGVGSPVEAVKHILTEIAEAKK